MNYIAIYRVNQSHKFTGCFNLIFVDKNCDSSHQHITDGTDSQVDDHPFICRQYIRPDVEQTAKEVEHLMHYDTVKKIFVLKIDVAQGNIEADYGCQEKCSICNENDWREALHKP